MNQFFVESLDIREHPIKKAKKKTRKEYITALSYIINKTIEDADDAQTDAKKYVIERLRLYSSQLFAGLTTTNTGKTQEKRCVSAFAKPWRSKYCNMLVCDAALILLKDDLVLHAMEIIKESLPFKYKAGVENIHLLLHSTQEIEKKYLPSAPLIRQYRANKDFFQREERRIILTANISAGKSTLINALIGKPIARTSQEVCTGNVCYLFNKAYEDGNIHLSKQELDLSATANSLRNYDWNGNISIASYFTGIMPDLPRLCIIDTPGVDAALYREHSERTHDVLLNGEYDTVLYVVSPTRLGTEAEKKHLQWVVQNLQKKKIIFVLNKLDDYRDFSDSIQKSVHDFKEDLLKIGFENPVICPISAYFSYLIKLRMTGQAFSEDEADEYALYSKKFRRSSYDLSHYYEGVQCLPTDSEEIELSKRAGLYGLEKIIYGGRS